MSSGDKSRQRRDSFAEYISIMSRNGGALSEDALTKLNEAFNVTDADIMNMARDIATDSPLDVRIARFMLIMEDLRDYRDSLQIKADRKSILAESIQDDKTINEGYLFLG